MNIDTSYKLNKIKNQKQLHKLIKNVQSEITNSYKSLYIKEAALLSGFLIYANKIGGDFDFVRSYLFKEYNYKLKENTNIETVLKEISERDFSSNSPKHKHFNFNCKGTLYLCKDEIYLRLSLYNINYLKILGYYDTDWGLHDGKFRELLPYDCEIGAIAPHGIPQRKWEDRQREWNNVLEDSIKMKVGLTVMNTDLFLPEVLTEVIAQQDILSTKIALFILKEKGLYRSVEHSKLDSAIVKTKSPILNSIRTLNLVLDDFKTIL